SIEVWVVTDDELQSSNKSREACPKSSRATPRISLSSTPLVVRPSARSSRKAYARKPRPSSHDSSVSPSGPRFVWGAAMPLEYVGGAHEVSRIDRIGDFSPSNVQLLARSAGAQTRVRAAPLEVVE